MHHLIKELQKEHADILTTDAHLCEKLNPNSWPQEILQAEITTAIPGTTSKENQSEAVLRAPVLEEINKRSTTVSWTHIYTDGSAENTTKNMEDMVSTSSDQANLHFLLQHLVGYSAQTTELKSEHC